MPRFILLDPSLISTVGHHCEFARNVLDAASAAGWSGVLAGHRRSTLAECGRWPVRRLFRDGLWTHQAGHPGLKLAGYAASVLRRAPGWIPRIHTRVQEQRDDWRASRFARDVERLLVEIGPEPDDLVFIPNATCAEVLGLTRLLRDRPAAREATWHLEFHFNVFPRGEVHRAGHFRATGRLQRALRELRAGPGGQRVMMYTDTEQLTGQYEALAAGPFCTLPIPVDPLCRAQEFADDPSAATVPFLKPLPGEPGRHEADWRQSATFRDAAGPPKRPLLAAYLGDARVEKGYPQLPAAIREVWPELVQTGRLRFAIQSNCRAAGSERAAQAARNELSRLLPPHLEFLPAPLDSDEYRALLLAADVLLLPYSPEAYEARSSGVMSEALAAGIPVAVPAGTWLSAQLGDEILRHRSDAHSPGDWPAARGAADDIIVRGRPGTVPVGRVGVVYENGPQGLALGLREIVAHFAHYRGTALVFSATWRVRHNPRRLVETLAQLAATAAVRCSVSSCRA